MSWRSIKHDQQYMNQEAPSFILKEITNVCIMQSLFCVLDPFAGGKACLWHVHAVQSEDNFQKPTFFDQGIKH